MNRVSSKGFTVVSSVAIGAILLSVGIALGQSVITRDQPALVSVIGQLSIHETLVLYPDLNGQPDLANPLGPNAVLDFGDVELDAFGNIAGGPPRIPIYILNNAGSDITLTVEASGDGPEPMIEVLFGPRGGEITPAPDNATSILMGQILTADLGMQFTATPGTGDVNFVVNFIAESEPAGPSGIVFSSDRDGNQEIYVMDADGSNPIRLTENLARDQAPVWSPDGNRIAFQSDRDGGWQIYVMDSDGSGQTRLTAGGENLWLTWSPDGTKLAFNSDREGNSQIYVTDDDGSNVTRLTNNVYDNTQPDWSPDGLRIAFRSNRSGDARIYVMDTNGSNQVLLTSTGGLNADPDWSPDGGLIAFRSNRDGNEEIYVMNADGSNNVRLTNHSAPDGYPAWSPSGGLIAFQSGRGENNELYRMDADGSNLTRLTNHPANDGYPSWSPSVGP